MDLAKDSFESLKQRVWQALLGALSDEVYGYDIVHTFPDACILRNYNTATFYRVEFVDDGEEATLRGLEEVEEAYVVSAVVEATGADEASVVKSLKSIKSAKLTAVIVIKSNDERRIAYGPVLVPDEPDSDGDVVTSEKIEEVAHKFLRDYGNIDLQHTLNVVAKPVESYIAPTDLLFGDFTVPKGSWMMGVYIEDDATWKAVKSGEIGGFSIMGVKAATAQEALKNNEPVALKRVTLADLGDDWECPFVSVVDTPAVPKAKFLVVKSAKKEGLIEKLRVKLAGVQAEKAGRRFSKQTYDTLKVAADTLAKLVEEAAKEHEDTAAEKQGREEDVDETKVQEMIDAAVSPIAESVKSMDESLKALVTKSEETPAEEPVVTEEQVAKSEETPAAEAVAETSEVEALKAKLTEQEATITELTEFKESVAKRFGGTAPKGLKGQDGDEKPATKGAADLEGRDAYGRRVRS